MASYLKSTIRKFIRVNHFSTQIYLTSSFIRQDDITIAVEYLVVIVADFSWILVILVMLYCLKLL